ncbi:endonuclease/exonuclease/phosphatase family protein [Loktanella salsilacus]|uniref:endonuclease/exonuclease/phosphatase family protein n=1 Tax=Loktanella salsilacus TaxID=195913 RepID=UPI0030FBE0BC
MRRWITRIIALPLLVLIIATIIGQLNTDQWWVRALDFPRLQIAAGLAALTALYALIAGWRGFIVTAAALGALGVQVWTLWPYQPIAAKMVAHTPRCADDGRLRVLSTNVQLGNQDAGQVLDMITDSNADIVLVMETNDRWDRDLAPLNQTFEHVMQAQPVDARYYGMQVYSRYPLADARFEYPFDSDTPLFVGDVEHPRQTVQFIGVHPRPPQIGQSSTMRDAAVLTAAKIAQDSDAVSIVAGDFNATSWSDTSRLALRTGGLLDPRQGRGPMVSFDAESRWMKWPLDQILWQGGPGLLDFTVLPAVGSDHYPVQADLCLTTSAEGTPAAPRDGDAGAVQAIFDAAAKG